MVTAPGVEVRKRVFLRRRFTLKIQSFYQDRLGTNIDRESTQKERCVFFQGLYVVATNNKEDVWVTKVEFESLAAAAAAPAA